VAPGVSRPVTLPDILNQLAGQAEGDTDTTVSGVGYFAEADEIMPLADAASAVTQAAATGWGEGQWSAVTWGLAVRAWASKGT
jgi:hypothetical protein